MFMNIIITIFIQASILLMCMLIPISPHVSYYKFSISEMTQLIIIVCIDYQYYKAIYECEYFEGNYFNAMFATFNDLSGQSYVGWNSGSTMYAISSFDDARGIAYQSNTNQIYIADYGNNSIRNITGAQTVNNIQPSHKFIDLVGVYALTIDIAQTNLYATTNKIYKINIGTRLITLLSSSKLKIIFFLIVQKSFIYL